MKVQCQGCGTAFRLDEALVPAEGAWVKCSQCGEVFQIHPEPKHAGHWESGEDGVLDLSDRPRPEDESLRERADFGLRQQRLVAERPPRGLLFKLVFWLIGLLLLVALTALGAVVVMSRLGVGHEVVERAARLPGLAPLLGRPAGAGAPKVPPGAEAFSLTEVKSFSRINDASGRIFVILGKVVNHNPGPRSLVLVQGTLRDATGKVVGQATSYAGGVFNPDQLRDLGLETIKQRLSSPEGLDGKPYVVAAGQALPFMIVLSDLPDQPLEYTAAVIGSDPVKERPVRP
ncbi:DUF3426 domain-containing protein [Desulfoferula mesophila]|uniref:Zinc finger/thioredoxin putative domain-containing protein n=1 Tax=Desulfoferula mesophila TaxID=3058419 RepID=A0AAU9EGE0_9BACT|nr:hypothetical protein FAK_26280 [Desulfoferula mesophilus]